MPLLIIRHRRLAKVQIPREGQAYLVSVRKEGQEKYGVKYDLDMNNEIGIPDFLIFVDSFGKVLNRAPVFTSESSVMLSLVEITARDEYGLSATQTIDVSVQAATLPNPVVAFDTDNEDLTIQFTDRFEAGETRVYDVRVRQQNPLGLVGQTRADGPSP